jgi:hypothetical protein
MKLKASGPEEHTCMVSWQAANHVMYESVELGSRNKEETDEVWEVKVKSHSLQTYGERRYRSTHS